MSDKGPSDPGSCGRALHSITGAHHRDPGETGAWRWWSLDSVLDVELIVLFWFGGGHLGYFFCLIGAYLLYNVGFVSSVQQSSSLYRYTRPFFFRFFSHIGYSRILSRVPCAIYSRTSSLIHSKCNSLYLPSPDSIPVPPHSPLACFCFINKFTCVILKLDSIYK